MAEQETSPFSLPGFEVIRLHFSVDEEATRKAMSQKRQMSPEDWEREHNLKSVGGQTSYAVFSGWRREFHEDTNLQYKPAWGTIYRGWDFGRVRPAVELFQANGRLVDGIDEITDENIDLDAFCEKVLAHCNRYYSKAHFADRCDPSGRNQKDTGKSSVAILRDFGLKPRWKLYRDGDGLEESITTVTRLVMGLDHSGRPLLQINPRKMPRLAEAMRGGYRRNKRGEVIKDGKVDHFIDAARYAIIPVAPVKGRHGRADVHTEKAKNYRYQPRNDITGY
jgi:hypothetical protein